MNRNICIFDLDGTLSDGTHRLHLLPKKISTLQKVGANLMARQLETAQSKALLTWRMRFIDPE